MTHRMILASADLKEIYKVVVARRKHAGVAQVEEQRSRKAQGEISNISTGPSSEEEDAA